MRSNPDRLHRLGAAVQSTGATFALITAPVTMRYLTGWSNPSKRLSALLVATTGQAALVVPALEVGEAEGTGVPLFSWRDGTDPFVAVASAANSLGVALTSAGVERSAITLAVFEDAKRVLGFAQSIDIGDAVGDLRAHKDVEEVSLLERGGEIINRALEQVLPQIRPGMTESQVATMLERAMIEAGADGPAFDTHVLVGARAALPHGSTGQEPVREGDVLLMDFGAMVQGYRSDITRCVSVGRWSTRMAEIYDIVLRAHDAAIAVASPGVTYHEIDRAARQVIEEAGYGPYFTHRTGHGLGLEIHEEPYVVAGNDRRAEPGHVVTVEPGIYLPGVGGIRIEDDVVITETGCRLLTSWPTDRTTVG